MRPDDPYGRAFAYGATVTVPVLLTPESVAVTVTVVLDVAPEAMAVMLARCFCGCHTLAEERAQINQRWFDRGLVAGFDTHDAHSP